MAQGASSSPINSSSAPQCSICLEAVVENNGRSTARLRCGHLFHLDCIGSEFNVKGVMQCPNCRSTENGEWLFAAGDFEQSVNEEDRDDEQYQIEMMVQHPSGLLWCPFNGFHEAPTLLWERTLTQTPNSVTQEIFLVSGGSNLGPNHMHPWNGHQVATAIPTLPSINDIHLYQHNWVPQIPFPSQDNTLNATNQALISPAIFRIADIFSYSRPGQEASAHPVTHDRIPLGFVGALLGSPHPGSNGPSLSRFLFSCEQPSSNLPSPVVHASILGRMGRSHNLGGRHQAGASLPSAEWALNGTNQVLLPRVSSGAGHGMLQGHASDGVPPENQTDDSGIIMYQFL